LTELQIQGIQIYLGPSGCIFVPQLQVMAFAMSGSIPSQGHLFDQEFDLVLPLREARVLWQPRVVMGIFDSTPVLSQADFGGEIAVIEPFGARARAVDFVTFQCSYDAESSGALLIAPQNADVASSHRGWLHNLNSLLLPVVGNDLEVGSQIPPGWDFVPLEMRDIMTL